MQELNPLKWTFRFLKIQLYLPLLLSGTFVVLIMLKVLPNFYALLLVAAMLLGYSYLVSFVLKGLEKKKEYSWTMALITVGLCLPTIMLPFAILSLVELFDKEAKRNYFKKNVNLGTPEEPVYSYSSVSQNSYKTDNSVLKAGLFCGILVVLLAVYVGFDGKSSTVKLDQNLSPQQLYRMGAECNSKGNTACSIAVFQKLLEIDPADRVALANLGMAQVTAGLHDEAAATFKTYFDRGGQGIDAMAYYAQTLNTLGRQTEALSWYAQALAQSPNLIDVAESMAQILASQNRYEEGLDLLNRFIEKNPSAAKYLQSRRELLLEKVQEIKETTI